MSFFHRAGAVIQLRCTEFEIAILTSMTQQVAGLLEGDAQPLADDPFVRWQAELTQADLDFSDPVIARLFPSSQPGD
ncbi:MAG: DUF2017 domain-containing protein, partial [Propionibacteriaceae bacterium]|nr:DUF2017 domain-containing protein [Propionibacteriaceae bacterium]